MIKTSGSEIWCLHNDEFKKIACVTSFQPASKTYGTRDRTGLEHTVERKEAGGRMSFGDVSMQLTIQNGLMQELFDGVTTRDYVVGLGDGTVAPAYSNGVITLFDSRTWHYFDGVITSEAHDALAADELLSGSYELIVSNYAGYQLKSAEEETQITVPWNATTPWNTDTYWR